jgi:5-methylcytosine-specific restriction protein A
MKLCAQCGEPFVRNLKYSAAQWEAASFCSNVCRGAAKTKARPCCACGCGERVHRSSNRYKRGHVSRVRKDFYRRGPDHAQWKGGPSDIRLSEAWRRVRLEAYARDGYLCVDCGARGQHAHHVKPLADFPELGLDLGNVVTVCVPCHLARHGMKPRASTPKE